MKSNKGKGLLGLLGLLVVLGIFGFFGYDTLQKSKLVTDENGVTSQNGGIKLGLDLASTSCSREYRTTALRQRFIRKAETVSMLIFRVSQTRTRSWKSSVSRDPYSSMMRTGMLYWKEPM